MSSFVFPDGGGIVESRTMHQWQLPWPCLALNYATSRRERDTTSAAAADGDGDGRPRADNEPDAGAPEPSPSTEARVPAEWSHGPAWSSERSNGAGPTSPPVVSLCLSGCCCPFGPASLETTHRGS